MTKDNICNVYLCNEKTLKGSNYCCESHEEMEQANDLLNEMLWNGEVPFEK